MAFYDRIKTVAATANGTGNITWTVAADQHALPPASISESVIYTVLDSGGAIWETGVAAISESGGTYTITRGGAQTVTDGSSGAGSAVTLTNSSAHTLFLTPDATSFRRIQPDEAATTVTTADVTAEVNKHYILTISGMTADRNLVLPSGAASGDVVSWELVTDAPAAYELILKGDTGVTVTLRNESTTASEATRYLIEGETGKAVYDGSEWRINKANDGRIPMQFKATLTTECDGEPAATEVQPSDYGGVWTEDFDVGSASDLAEDRWVARRDCVCQISINGRRKDADSGIFFLRIYNGSTALLTARVTPASSDNTTAGNSALAAFVVDGEAQYFYSSVSGGKGLSAVVGNCYFSVSEML